MSRQCFECGEIGNMHDHHVVPRSRGGTSTVPLCDECHGKTHGLPSGTDWDISTLTSEAMQAKAARGEYTGGKVPFGKKVSDDGKTLVDNPAEQEVIDEIRRMRNKGLLLRDIAEELNNRGAVRRNQNGWHQKAVSRVLKGCDGQR